MQNSNLMSNLYTGYITEIILKDGKPTFEIKVRVPSVHGASAQFGVADKDLPIAKPMFIPGAYLSSDKFIEFINHLDKVYIIFESGDYNNPVYFGVKGNSDIYDIPIDDIPEVEGDINVDSINVPAIERYKINGESIGNFLLNHVVKDTEPTAGDYGRDIIPHGAVWLDTSEAEEIEGGGMLMMMQSPAYNYSTYLNIYDTSPSAMLSEINNFILNINKDILDSWTNTIVDDTNYFPFNETGELAPKRLQLLNIIAGTDKYCLEYYKTVKVIPNNDRYDYHYTWTWYLAHYVNNELEISDNFYIRGSSIFINSIEEPIAPASLIFNLITNKLLLPQESIIINNLHLAPRLFYTTIE